MKSDENDTQEEKRTTTETDDSLNAPEPGSNQNARDAAPAGILARVRSLLDSQQQQAPASLRDLSKDRTRSLLLLIGGTVGAVLLFIGVFSTPPRSSLPEARRLSGPNLGRPAAATAPVPASKGSVVPLLAADVRSTDTARNPVSPADISGTASRTNSVEQESISSPIEPTRPPRAYRPPATRERPADPPITSQSTEDDPLAEYRIDNGAGDSTNQYGASRPSSAAPGRETFSYGESGQASQVVPRSASHPPRSSFVFVRDAKFGSIPRPVEPSGEPLQRREPGIPLPPGTRLIARVDAAATSALSTPLVASVEYNYERAGIVVVPAGSKVIGEVRQASADGYVDARFHTLRTPDGRDLPIDATATSLDMKPLRGTVSGKNTGKKLLSRTLTGVGTIAAYVVGGGGGLSSAVTGETLLRDRVAGNIAMAGEEQLRNAAYAQNVVVTLPANMRIYVVLQKEAVKIPEPTTIADIPARRIQSDLPTVQELRELMDLRREINLMYQESNASPSESR